MWDVQCETEISFKLIPSLTRSHTKSRTKQLREEVILVKEDISLKDNSFSHCMYMCMSNCMSAEGCRGMERYTSITIFCILVLAWAGPVPLS